MVGPVATEADSLGPAHEPRSVVALLDVDLEPGGCRVALARSLHVQLGIRALFVSASYERARTARDVAFGLMSKPWESRALVHAVAACSALLAGRRPDPLPRGLELFG